MGEAGTVRVLARDGEVFGWSHEAVQCAVTLKNMMEDTSDDTPLKVDVAATVLATLEPMLDPDYDPQCIGAHSIAQLFKLVEGANQLDAARALEHLQRAMAGRLAGKRADELRTMLGATDDVTGEEERAAARAEPSFTPVADTAYAQEDNTVQELAVHMVDVGTLLELKGVDQSWRSIARSVLCWRLCAVRDCRTQLSEIAELDVERLNGAGQLWEAAMAGLRLPNLARLRGYGFVVDVAMARGVHLGNSFAVAKAALRGCIAGEGEPPLELLIPAIACAGTGEMGGIPVEAMRNGGLVELNLSRKGVGDEEAMLVACLVPAMGSLAQLYLTGNQIGDEGAKALADGVAASGSLARLEISGNDIGDEGAKAIADAVAASGSLATLGLHSNNIGDEGAKALAAGVAASGSLAELWLSGNMIGDEGAKALAAGVAASGSLAELNLGLNHIGDEGAKALAAGVAASGSLACLNLYGNSIGDDGAKALAAAAGTSFFSASEPLGPHGLKMKHAELKWLPASRRAWSSFELLDSRVECCVL